MAPSDLAGRQLDVYPLSRMQRLGSIVIIQPVWGPDSIVAGPSLTCDLESGCLAVSEHPKVDKD